MTDDFYASRLQPQPEIGAGADGNAYRAWNRQFSASRLYADLPLTEEQRRSQQVHGIYDGSPQYGGLESYDKTRKADVRGLGDEARKPGETDTAFQLRTAYRDKLVASRTDLMAAMGADAQRPKLMTNAEVIANLRAREEAERTGNVLR